MVPAPAAGETLTRGRSSGSFPPPHDLASCGVGSDRIAELAGLTLPDFMRTRRAPEPGIAAGAAFFLAFVLIWWAYGTIADAGKALDGDVIEAYVWGREFRLGYNQHPPLWAWICGAWFELFPARSWAFHLLAVVNSGVGLLGCWRLIGLFATGWTRLASFALLLLTPFYTFLCYKYNANSIFLSIWPWTLYFFVASLTTRRRADAIWFSVLLAAAMLSKYYAITLALTCLAASMVHPARRAYYRSASPYISVCICVLLVLPHVFWLVTSDAPPVAYILARTGGGMLRAVRYGGELLGAIALFHVAAILVVLAAAYPSIRFAREPLGRERLLLVLVLVPIVLTILFGLVFELEVSSNMMIGTFPLVPLLLIRAIPSAEPWRIARVSILAAAASAVAVLIASPAVAYVAFHSNDPAATEPREELAAYVTQLWHEQTGTKLRIVAGTDPYENAIGFYSPDQPKVFIGFSEWKAPWITPAALARDGLLVVCLRAYAFCPVQAEPFLSPDTKRFTVSLAHEFRGQRRDPMEFTILLVPPKAPRK